MNGLQEKIDLLWFVNREHVFKKVEENAEYSSLLVNLKAKEEILRSKVVPDKRKEVIDYIETKVLADTIAAQGIYREGFIEGIKTAIQIIQACKPMQKTGINKLPPKCPPKPKTPSQTKKPDL